VSRTGCGSPDRPQYADADKRSGFERVGIRAEGATKTALHRHAERLSYGSKVHIVLPMRPDQIVGCATAKTPPLDGLRRPVGD
jgi:hypothetical protein